MKITFSIFPKYYRHLGLEELAALVREVGLDATNVVIRDGYWVTRANMAEALPEFVRTMRASGLDTTFATAGFEFDELLNDPTPLAVLAESGVTDFRPAYFKREPDVRKAFASAREKLRRLAPLCERYGTRCVYQVHHGTLVPSASAAYRLIEGLPARAVGIELDPGNQAFEGFEDWEASARLLGEHLAAFGVKDSSLVREDSRAGEPSKGWTRRWCPVYEGVTNWHDVVKACAAVGFRGTFIFMPFYDPDDPAAITRKLGREVAYLREVLAAVEAEGRAAEGRK